MPSSRDILYGLFGCLALLSVGHTAILRAVEQTPKTTPIVIIGAGPSGLAAAQRLFDLGFTHVSVLEAQSRTGGRVHSQEFGSDEKHFVELGAEQVHGTNHPVYDYGRANNLLVESTTLDEGYRFQNGAVATEKEKGLLDTAVDEFFRINLSVMDKTSSALSANELQNISMESTRAFHFLNTFDSLPEDETRSRINMLAYDYVIRLEMVETACPVPYKLLSSRYYTDYTQHGANYLINPSVTYESVVKGMTSTFPRLWIHTDTPVQEIRLNSAAGGSRVTVTSTTGATFPADYVIVTVSLGVLKSSPNLFQPELSPKKREAIAKSGFGSVTKVFLKFPTPFWENLEPKGARSYALIWTDVLMNIPYNLEAVRTFPAQETPKWYRHAVDFAPVPSSPSTILLWVVGPGAYLVDKLSNEELLNDAWELLQKFAGSVTVPKPEAVIRARWSTNQYTQGTYSYFSLASSRANLNPADLEEPQWEFANEHAGGSLAHSLLFAGEATHRDFFSTVHGAILAGQREANRIAMFHSPATTTAPSTSTTLKSGATVLERISLKLFSLLTTFALAGNVI